MLIRIIGLLVAIWLVFTVVGAVVHLLLPLIIVGLVVGGGVAVYGAIRNRDRRQLP